MSALDALYRTDPAAFAAHYSRGAFKRPPHIRYISRMAADAIRRGGARLLFSLPPRHGKSELFAKWLPVWCLARDSGAHVGVVSYADELAEKSVRAARDLTTEFGSELGLRVNVERADYIEVRAPNGRPPGFIRAAGIGAGLTGWGFDVIVLDDLFKNEEEAYSPAHRQKVWDRYETSIASRLDTAHGSIIGIMTRWHRDDLFGRLIEAGEFIEIRIPAIAEEDDPIGRDVGTALWPDRVTLDHLEAIRKARNPKVWFALYQGRPVAAEGAMFSRGWWRTMPARPEAGRITSCVRFWDTAGSKSEKKGDPDYAVGCLMYATDTRGYVAAEIDRDRGTPLDCERRIIAAAHRDGKSVPVRIAQEPGDAGLFMVQHYVRQLPGWDVAGVRESGDKITRARPFAAQLEAGNVSMVAAPWNVPMLDELDTFPNGDHDDIVDSLSGAFRVLVGDARVTAPDATTSSRSRPAVSDFDRDDDAAPPASERSRVLAGAFGSGLRNTSSGRVGHWPW